MKKTDKQRAKNLGLSEKDYKRLKEQVSNEIAVSLAFMQPSFELNNNRIKLFNNQKKKKTAVSDPMLFTHFQTVQASLYEDKLSVGFAPRTKADIAQAENLNPLYEYDAVDMDKAIVDYKTEWNALFFGRSLCLMSQWNSKLLCPSPEVINMLTWCRDPNATSVNGDSEGRGSMRLGGRPISKTLDEFKKDSVYKNIDELDESTNPENEEAQRQIDNAQGFETLGDVEGENKNYTIMEWWTKFSIKNEKGEMEQKRVLVGYQNGLIVRFTILKDQEQWGIIDRTIYPDAISWDGVNVVDLIEDKQRANARILNAALFNVDSNTYNMGFYDATKITKPSHLTYAHNKRIPVNGDVGGVYQPMQTNQVGQEVNYIMQTLKDLAQRATGATELQQGAMSGSKRTATEVATVSEGADTRFSLAAKIFGWSEKAFARYWYKMYKMYYTKAIDEKVMRVNGLIGYKWKSLKRSDIVGIADPEIKVESKIVSEARRLRELQNFTNAYPILVADPTTNKEFLTRRWAKLNGYSTMDMQMLFNPSSDRLVAQLENQNWIDKKEVPKIGETDDDWVHIDEHQKEDGLEEHIKAHMTAVMVKAKNPNIQEEVAALAPAMPEVPIEKPNYNTPNILQTA